MQPPVRPPKNGRRWRRPAARYEPFRFRLCSRPTHALRAKPRRAAADTTHPRLGAAVSAPWWAAWRTQSWALLGKGSNCSLSRGRPSGHPRPRRSCTTAHRPRGTPCEALRAAPAARSAPAGASVVTFHERRVTFHRWPVRGRMPRPQRKLAAATRPSVVRGAVAARLGPQHRAVGCG